MSYHDNLDFREQTAFAALIQELKPGATGRDLPALLAGKVHRTTALNWMAGRYNPPQWAVDLLVAQLRTRLAERAALTEQLATKTIIGVGRRASAKNLAIYLQRKSRATKPGSP